MQWAFFRIRVTGVAEGEGEGVEPISPLGASVEYTQGEAKIRNKTSTKADIEGTDKGQLLIVHFLRGKDQEMVNGALHPACSS